MRRGQPPRAASWALGVYCALLAVLVFSPVAPSLRGVPLPAGIHAGAIEAAANVAVFAPAGFLVAALLPPRRRWLTAVRRLLAPVSIETIQGIVISARVSPGARDVLTDTTGAVIGVSCFAAWWLHTRPRPSNLSADEGPPASATSSTA